MKINESVLKMNKQELVDILLYLLDKEIITNNDINNYLSSISENNNNEDCKRIFDFYNELKIKSHRILTPEMSKAIKKALKLYSEKEICVAMKRYSKVLKDEHFFFDYKWGLAEFLSRKEGMASFLNNGNKWINYISSRPVVDTDAYFESLWGIYETENPLSKEFARAEFDKKFIGKNNESARDLANIIYKKMVEYLRDVQDGFVQKFANWLRCEIPNGTVQTIGGDTN